PMMTGFEIEVVRQHYFASESFERLIQFGLTILMNKSLSRLRFCTLNVQRTTRVAHFASTTIQIGKLFRQFISTLTSLMQLRRQVGNLFFFTSTIAFNRAGLLFEV